MSCHRADSGDFIWGVGIGAGFAMLLVLALGAWVDIAPTEAPMIAACQSHNSTLRSYDDFKLTCNNGLIISREELSNEQ